MNPAAHATPVPSAQAAAFPHYAFVKSSFLCNQLVLQVATDQKIELVQGGNTLEVVGTLWRPETDSVENPSHLFVTINNPLPEGLEFYKTVPGVEPCLVLEMDKHKPPAGLRQYLGMAVDAGGMVKGALVLVTGTLIYISKVKRAADRLKLPERAQLVQTGVQNGARQAARFIQHRLNVSWDMARRRLFVQVLDEQRDIVLAEMGIRRTHTA